MMRQIGLAGAEAALERACDSVAGRLVQALLELPEGVGFLLGFASHGRIRAVFGTRRQHPGSAFGREGYLRLSFATSEAEIRKAMERFARCVASLE